MKIEYLGQLSSQLKEDTCPYYKRERVRKRKTEREREIKRMAKRDERKRKGVKDWKYNLEKTDRNESRCRRAMRVDGNGYMD